MMHQIKTAFYRSQGTLLQDGVAVAALMLLLLAGLFVAG